MSLFHPTPSQEHTSLLSVSLSFLVLSLAAICFCSASFCSATVLFHDTMRSEDVEEVGLRGGTPGSASKEKVSVWAAGEGVTAVTAVTAVAAVAAVLVLRKNPPGCLAAERLNVSVFIMSSESMVN